MSRPHALVCWCASPLGWTGIYVSAFSFAPSPPYPSPAPLPSPFPPSRLRRMQRAQERIELASRILSLSSMSSDGSSQRDAMTSGNTSRTLLGVESPKYRNHAQPQPRARTVYFEDTEGEPSGTVKVLRTRAPKKTKVERSKTFKDKVKEKEKEKEKESGLSKERERGGGGGGTVGTGGGGGGDEMPEVAMVTEHQVRLWMGDMHLHCTFYACQLVQPMWLDIMCVSWKLNPGILCILRYP